MRIGAVFVVRAAVAMAVFTAVFTAIFTAACGGGGFFRQYEYEEEMYLSLDGSATLYVNSSVAALNALRGTSFDPDPAARLDRDAIRDYFTTAVTSVARQPSLSRRSGRLFVHVRVDVADITKLGEAAPFSWSAYQFARNGDQFRYLQTMTGGAAAARPDATWTGEELTAVRVHLPSRIVFHNAGRGNPQRGNILGWEQSLTARLAGEPLVMEARMDAQSVLYRTLFLFFVTFLVVAVGFVVLIWLIVRRGGNKPAAV
jgi:hypothetical protein